MFLLALQPAATARFLLARHGQTNFNAEGRMQGTLDTSVLTLEGISQVAGLGHWMATHEAARVDHAWCSPMTRARQSYAAVAGVCAAAGCALPDETIRDDLREIELHVWEGRLKTDIARDDADGWALWRRAPEEYAFPGGAGGRGGRAPLLDLWARAEGNWAALRRDAAPGSTTFVLSHGALGRTLLGTALGLEPSMFRDDHYEFGNADLVEVEWAPGEERATRWRKRFRDETAWMTAEEAAARAVVVGGEGAATAF